MVCHNKGLLYACIACLCMIFSPALFAQAPSSKLPDLQYFKITYPVNSSGQDNRNVSYNNRSSNYVKAAEVTNLNNYTPNSTYSPYFFVSGNDVVFKAHCAGALTSANAYPRCELREKVNGGDDLWRFSDEHELNATFRVTNLPNEKQEVCMLQIKGNSSNSTSGTEEAFRLEYRADGSSGVHLTINENTTRNNVMDYSEGQTMVARMYVNNGSITITLNNLNVSGSRGQYTTTYSSNYSWGYFKAGCYTQSSIWGEKTGRPDENNNAYGEVRFSALTLGSNSGPTCTASVPGNRRMGSVGTSTATFNWNTVSNIDHYKLRYRSVGGSWVTSPSIRNTTSYSVSGLSNNTTYQWQIRSKCSDGTASNYNSGSGPNFTTGGSSGGNVVTMRKRNSSGYALDGRGGGANGQNIHLWSFSTSNINQKWIEINRGGGYYSYQKANTNYCIDGGNGGASGQNVYIWTCGANNQNQHWKKVSMGSGAYRLEKRNASGYSIDGMGGGSNGQNVHLWANNNNNQNQHWVFGSASIREGSESIESTPQIQYFPNPFSTNLTVSIPAEAQGITSIRISDMMGRIVYANGGLNPGEKIKIAEGLSSGLYLLQWLDEKGKLLQTEKVTKQ